MNQDEKQTETKSSQSSLAHPAIAVRVMLVTALSLTFLVAIRWASDVTHANAKQISHNLTAVQQKMNRETQQNAPQKVYGAPLLENLDHKQGVGR